MSTGTFHFEPSELHPVQFSKETVKFIGEGIRLYLKTAFIIIIIFIIIYYFADKINKN